MNDSALLGAVVDECAAWPSQFVVEGDCGGEAAEAGADAFPDAGERAGAVPLERERSLQVQKIDSIRCRIGARRGPCPVSSLRLGRTIVAPRPATSAANLRPT